MQNSKKEKEETVKIYSVSMATKDFVFISAKFGNTLKKFLNDNHALRSITEGKTIIFCFEEQEQAEKFAESVKKFCPSLIVREPEEVGRDMALKLKTDAGKIRRTKQGLFAAVEEIANEFVKEKRKAAEEAEKNITAAPVGESRSVTRRGYSAAGGEMS